MRGKLARELRRQAAEERQAIHNKLSIEQRIKKLDDKFGKNKGAKKERTKLKKMLESQKVKAKNAPKKADKINKKNKPKKEKK